MFTNSTSQMQVTYAVSMLGLLATYSLQWIYFDVDASRNFQHAIRRYVITGFLFWAAHLPLQMAIVAAGAALGVIVDITQEYSEAPPTASAAELESILPTSIRWLYCVSIATALWCMSFVGMLHKSLDQVTVTPLDTIGKKVVNFISGYGFVATRQAAPAPATPQSATSLVGRGAHDARDAHDAAAGEEAAGVESHPTGPSTAGGSRTSESNPAGTGSESSPSTTDAAMAAQRHSQRRVQSDIFQRLRARFTTTPHANHHLSVTNLRKTTRIFVRVMIGLAISLLPLAGTDLSPAGLVGTTAALLALLVVFELWGGLRVNALKGTAHFSPQSGLAAALIAAAAPSAPSAVLSLHDIHDGDHHKTTAHHRVERSKSAVDAGGKHAGDEGPGLGHAGPGGKHEQGGNGKHGQGGNGKHGQGENGKHGQGENGKHGQEENGKHGQGENGKHGQGENDRHGQGIENEGPGLGQADAGGKHTGDEGPGLGHAGPNPTVDMPNK